MKKLFLSLALMLTGTFAFANNTEGLNDNTIEKNTDFKKNEEGWHHKICVVRVISKKNGLVYIVHVEIPEKASCNDPRVKRAAEIAVNSLSSVSF